MSDDTNKRDDRITVVFPAEVGRKLRHRAELEGTPVSILIRQWVMRILRQEERYDEP